MAATEWREVETYRAADPKHPGKTFLIRVREEVTVIEDAPRRTP